LGWYQSELLRRVDPLGRTIGKFFQDEIARPLGVHFHIGLPAEIAGNQLAFTAGFHRLQLLRHLGELPVVMVLAGLWPRSMVARSVNLLRLSNPAHLGSPAYRGVEIPAANGWGQARAIAKIYSVLAGDGHELRISPHTRRELLAPARLPRFGSRDAVLKINTNYGFGFSRPSSAMRFGSNATAFGCPGAGGCLGLGDPNEQLSFAYVTNKMGFYLFDDPRERACRDACFSCLSSPRDVKRAA
jgi:CubicO group peptidase (beta-lactamase class C family)